MKTLINYFKPSSDCLLKNKAESFAPQIRSSKVEPCASEAPCPYLCMYNRDKTICYYCTTNRKDFINSLKIHYATFEKHLENGTYYLGKYLFTREFVQLAKFKEMSMLELSSMLAKDRERFK